MRINRTIKPGVGVGLMAPSPHHIHRVMICSVYTHGALNARWRHIQGALDSQCERGIRAFWVHLCLFHYLERHFYEYFLLCRLYFCGTGLNWWWCLCCIFQGWVDVVAVPHFTNTSHDRGRRGSLGEQRCQWRWWLGRGNAEFSQALREIQNQGFSRFVEGNVSYMFDGVDRYFIGKMNWEFNNDQITSTTYARYNY